MFRGDKRRDLAVSKAFVRSYSTLLASASSKVPTHNNLWHPECQYTILSCLL